MVPSLTLKRSVHASVPFVHTVVSVNLPWMGLQGVLYSDGHTLCEPFPPPCSTWSKLGSMRNPWQQPCLRHILSSSANSTLTVTATCGLCSSGTPTLCRFVLRPDCKMR